MESFQGDAVAAAFAAFPEAERDGLLVLRDLIFDTAATLPEVGRIEETLKWGQPAYLTPETGSGTTLRLGVPKTGGFALFVHCQTTVIPEFRTLFGEDFAYDGNRAVIFETVQDLRPDALRPLIASALTYHARKRVAAS